jgi:hypothetical protein
VPATQLLPFRAARPNPPPTIALLPDAVLFEPPLTAEDVLVSQSSENACHHHFECLDAVREAIDDGRLELRSRPVAAAGLRRSPPERRTF